MLEASVCLVSSPSSTLTCSLNLHLFLYILIRVSQFFVLSWCRLQKMSESDMSMLFWCLLVYYIMPSLDLWHILVMFTSQRSQNWSPIEELGIGSRHAGPVWHGTVNIEMRREAVHIKIDSTHNTGESASVTRIQLTVIALLVSFGAV